MSLELILESVTAVTDRVSLFVFASADGDLPAYDAGAHVDFDLGDVGTRSYSLVDFTSPEAPPSRYRFAIQHEETGDGGSRAMHELKPGDKVMASAPKNDFALRDGDAPALLIAGGIGVTPIISFATELKRRGAPFAFHYAARTADVCAFRDRLAGTFSHELTIWFDDTGMIDLKALITGAAPDTQVYCCGPKGMIEAVRELADTAGIPKDHVHFELFATPAGHSGDQPFEVEIASTGQVFTIPADKSIIEVLEAEGIDVMYDCQRGDCGICQTDVIEGVPDHRDVVLSEAEKATGKVMQICVGRAKSARLVLDV